MDIADAFEGAVASTAGVVQHLRPDDLALPTPCTEWTVRDVLNHVVGTLWLTEGFLGDRAPRHTLTSSGLPKQDLVRRDPVGAYTAAAGATLTLARQEGALHGVRKTPFGVLPVPAFVGLTTLDVFVHGWDLARATVSLVELDEALAEHVLRFAHTAITDPMRGARIGPPVDVAGDAPAVDRLAAFLGRRP